MDRTEVKNKSNPLIRKLEKKLQTAKGEKAAWDIDTLKYELGYAYLDMGEIDKALDLFRGLSEETHKEEKFQGIFRAYVDSGRYDEARKLIPRLRRDFPESHSLLNSIGLYYYRTGDNYEALRYYDKAMEAAHAPEEILTVLYNKAIAFNQVRYFEEALKILKVLVELIDDDNHRIELAYCYSEKGEPKKAIKIYEDLEKKGVRTASVFGGLYCAYLKSGDYGKAFAVATAAVKKLPRSHPGLYENLAEAYQHAGVSGRKPPALKKALDVAHKGLEIFPGDDRLLKVRDSIEADARFLEEDLRMDAWRKNFRESSLTDDKKPVIVLARFKLLEDDDISEAMSDYVCEKEWFKVCSFYQFDDVNHVVLYRKYSWMGLDDYLGTVNRIKRGAKVIFLETDEKRRMQLNPETIEICKNRPFTILQCNMTFNRTRRKVTGVKWTDLLREVRSQV